MVVPESICNLSNKKLPRGHDHVPEDGAGREAGLSFIYLMVTFVFKMVVDFQGF
jgi:hypothetical protein